jgi:hypothetical protein
MANHKKNVQRSTTRLPGPARPAAGSGGASVHLVGAGAVIFTKGVEHRHAPSGRWSDIQAAPRTSDSVIAAACTFFSPDHLVDAAIVGEFKLKPIAFKHLRWYLADGGGSDFDEDENIKILLEQDVQIQALFRKSLAGGKGRVVGHRKITQSNYAPSLVGQDLRFAFGAIDRFDFIADFKAGTFQGWFQDLYEWHPFYPGIYSVKAGDAARDDNCVHAALVELKSGTARDFWMKGEATVDLAKIMTPPAPPSPFWPF